MVRTAGGLDEIVGRLTRRQFLKLCGTAVAVALLGCSGKSGSSSSESFAPAPSLSGHPELKYLDDVKSVPDDVIPKIEKAGEPYIEVWAPVEKALAFRVERNGKQIDVYPWEVREGDIVVFHVCGPSTEDLNTLPKEECKEIYKRANLFSVTIGDVYAELKNEDKMNLCILNHLEDI